MPTGSLAPDSPSSTVPLRPRSRDARARRRRRRGPSAPRPCRAAAPPTSRTRSTTLRGDGDSGRGRERAQDADRADHTDCASQPRPADVHAAVEQDRRHGDGHDALGGDERDVPEWRMDGGRRHREQEEDGGCRYLQPFAQAVGRDRDHGRHGRQQDERPKCARSSIWHLRVVEEWCRPDFPAHRDHAAAVRLNAPPVCPRCRARTGSADHSYTSGTWSWSSSACFGGSDLFVDAVAQA